MSTSTKRRIIIAAMTALICLAAFPITTLAAVPQTAVPVLATRELTARGVARQTIDGENVTLPANFTLMLQRADPSGTIPKFTVTAGTINVDGTIYLVTSGTGGVLRGRHAIVMEAQCTDPAGNTVTFKLAGRYFWMGGHLFVFRIAGALQTDSGKIILLMRAAIKV